MTKSNELGIPQVARKLGFTLKYVYDRVYSGRLKAEKVAGRWRVPVTAVDEILRQRKARQ